VGMFSNTNIWRLCNSQFLPPTPFLCSEGVDPVSETWLLKPCSLPDRSQGAIKDVAFLPNGTGIVYNVGIRWTDTNRKRLHTSTGHQPL
jgi:hypothetical protein